MLLLAEAKTVIYIEDRRAIVDGVIHGLSYKTAIGADELAELCVEKVPPYQLWSDGSVVCISWGGTT